MLSVMLAFVWDPCKLDVLQANDGEGLRFWVGRSMGNTVGV